MNDHCHDLIAALKDRIQHLEMELGILRAQIPEGSGKTFYEAIKYSEVTNETKGKD